jgi:NAD(P)-dependent dehydrogenase (short-subunit alcohol dehydrogenase family)
MAQAALITGASRGIGRGIALTLAQAGWQVGINFRSGQAAADETLTQVNNLGANGLLLPADVASASAREAMVDIFLERFGRIDLLVNNAGMAPRVRTGLLDVTEESYDEVLAVNLKAPFFLSQRVAREMITQVQTGILANPSIINMGSISAYTVSLTRGEYCVAKAGLGMVTALFAARLAEFGIRVYELRPGIIETDMTGPAKDHYNHLIAEGLTPIRRWGQPDDVARAVLAIAENRLPFSTGEVINIDGGFHLRIL